MLSFRFSVGPFCKDEQDSSENVIQDQAALNFERLSNSILPGNFS